MPGLPNPADFGKYFVLAQAGLEMVAPVVIGILIDHYLNSSPWGVVVGAVVGLVGGLWHLVIMAQRLEESESKPPRRPPKDEP